MDEKGLKAQMPAKSVQRVPQLTLDCIILGFHAGQLRVLLIRWKGTEEWSLPGGPIYQNESIDTAAYRILQERTGLSQIFLKQFHIFGDLVRYNRSEIQEKLKHLIPPSKWYERAISIGYYALVDYTKVVPTPDEYTDECRWWKIKEIPSLLFDHNKIIEVALKTLQVQASMQPVGINLLPDEFTMPELQRLYEAMLGRELDPRNFQKKIKSLDILERLNKRRKGGAYKSPYLYSFNKDRYEEALNNGDLSLF